MNSPHPSPFQALKYILCPYLGCLGMKVATENGLARFRTENRFGILPSVPSGREPEWL